MVQIIPEHENTKVEERLQVIFFMITDMSCDRSEVTGTHSKDQQQIKRENARMLACQGYTC